MGRDKVNGWSPVRYLWIVVEREKETGQAQGGLGGFWAGPGS